METKYQNFPKKEQQELESDLPSLGLLSLYHIAILILSSGVSDVCRAHFSPW